MGLVFPDDLGAWHRWQRSRNRVRHLRSLLRSDRHEQVSLTTVGADPRVLVVMDSWSPTNRAAMTTPLDHLGFGYAILSHALPVDASSAGVTRTLRPEEVHEGLTSVDAVLAAGHYLGLGALGHEIARRRGIQFLVAQHGLLTPLMAPLPPDAHLLAWSAADAEFWWSRRGGPSTVVGSQLLWDAGRESVEAVPTDRPIVYLGQLHGAELPTRDLARAAGRFCRDHGATYRPHPSETDRMSRWQHRRWERDGVRIDRSGTPLRESNASVVSVFSTGVLEAAARGIPAWVDYPDPPTWLREFWQRYDLRPYGADPTPAPPRPEVEPAVAVAEILRSYL